MHDITEAYSFCSHENQEFRGEPVEDLAIADCLQSIAEWNAFQTRIPPEPKADTNRRHAICIAFQSGAIGAVEAMHMLAEDELFGDPDYFVAAYAAGVAALSRETPPESCDVAPGQAKTVRVTSHAYRGLDALAEARSGRAA